MKKNGFTLAEVLITLAIVGVVAALTLPTLNQNTVAAQIGPKLAKAVASFEQANQALLQEYGVDALNETGLLPVGGELGNYTTALANHFKISAGELQNDGSDEPRGGGNICKVANFPRNGQPAVEPNAEGEGGQEYFSRIPGGVFITKDGMRFVLVRSGVLEDDPDNEGQKIYNLTDIAADSPHNQLLGNAYVDINGNNGPNEYGTDAFVFRWYNDGSLRPVGGSDVTDACRWTTACNVDATPTDAKACAGHVFENNLKVRYQ